MTSPWASIELSRNRHSDRGRAGWQALLPFLTAMAAVCDICGKKPFFGMQVSHSHRRSPKRWNPNIQRVRAVVNGSPKRLHVCTSCLKAGKVRRAV
jgi:large subunit ribosomal protein L28